MSVEPIVQVTDLSVYYGSVCALKQVSLTVYENDFIGVIGPNGGGKSSLIKALIGLIPHSEGSIEFRHPTDETKTLRIGYLPQYSEIDRQFPISVNDVIHSGLSNESSPWVRFRSNQKERVAQMIERVGLSELSKRPIAALSGGQLQRVLLARALISNPHLLVLDEPTSYLDQGFEEQLYRILTEANQHTAIIMVSHNISSVQAIAKSLACINQTLHYHPTTDISEACLYETFFATQSKQMKNGEIGRV